MVEIDIAEAFGAAAAREQRFAVYIPNKDREGNPVEQAKWIDQALALLSSICGGATAMPPIRGAWLNEVVALVHEIGRQTRQGQMAIEFNQTFYLIDIA